MSPTGRVSRVVITGVVAFATLLPTLVSHMTAPANHGAHALTSGFGRGRLDMSGIVSDGSGARIHLPAEPLILTVKVSGDGPVRLEGQGVDQTLIASSVPKSIRAPVEAGGSVSVLSPARIRLHELTLERSARPWSQVILLALLGCLGLWMSARSQARALGAIGLLLGGFALVATGTLSATFARIMLAKLAPLALILLLFIPFIVALREARFFSLRDVTPLARAAFLLSLGFTTTQLIVFDQPIPLGDPGAYFEMGGRFADAIRSLDGPLALGPILSDLQPYLALPATGMIYGVLRLLMDGLGLIFAIQALAMAVTVAVLAWICETHIGPRAARIAVAIALLHPSFSVLPGIVQPEPFILAAWTIAGLLALRAWSGNGGPRGFLGAGVFLGVGLSLHPQGLSFLLLALGLCLLPWLKDLASRPQALLAATLGTFSVLLPVAAAEHFAKPLAHVLDQQYGFFAYTSPHPLGFWLYTDSNGWQGPLRIEDTTYQKELIALKGESAVSSTFADVAAFALRHPAESSQTVLTNLHRLWHQPDNPFAVPFPLPHGLQIPLHRALLVLFVLSLPALLGSRLAIVALPFVMLSMTYPAYHVFNKYATPALPFTIMGASFTIDWLIKERGRRRFLLGGLVCASVGSLLPAGLAAAWSIPGDVFLPLARGLLWFGLAMALWASIRAIGGAARSRVLAAAIGAFVLLGSSVAASITDTERTAWSVALDRPFDVSCRLGDRASLASGSEAVEPWLLVDAQSMDGTPPQIEVNGRRLNPPVAAMPRYGLASIRGHRNPATFRQIWMAPLGNLLEAASELKVTVSGGPSIRVFGDIREGNDGPRLSIGDWPYLSVYRLMHEGQYRLPAPNTPPQRCQGSGISGRPGMALALIPPGRETELGTRSMAAVARVF